MIELRCDNNLHGRMIDEYTLEVKCKRRGCGVIPGVIVFHRIDIRTGETIETKRYADPRKELANGTQQSVASIRAPGHSVVSSQR